MNTISTNHSVSQQFNSDAHQSACENFFAQPYSLDATGFYFTNLDGYTAKAAALKDRYGNPVEEFEIMYIDGDDNALFNACGINQANLSVWFDEVAILDDHEKAALFYLVSVTGCTLSDALGKIDEVALYAGNLEDAAQELFDECYADNIPENLRSYIDYAAFARDCEHGGDMTEFEYGGETFTCTNASGV